MEQMDIRMSREQLDTVIDALAVAAEHNQASQLAADCEKIGAWLSYRYTQKWGLPRSAAAALARARASGG
ncbi:MAG TPA: hypothetical protein VGS06_44820 [Streptosporangiaceae bacterium]|nr:hypothetical protein [Streptosporangiaceae bacterium]